MRLIAAALLASSVWTFAARARAADDDEPGWRLLPGGARRYSRTHSVSRDAPVLGWAYGPRARLDLGTELGLVAYRGENHELVLGGSALVSTEDPDPDRVLPGFEATRDLETFSLAIAWSSGIEGAIAIGHEGAHLASGAAAVDPYRSDDIPFGGGGWFFGPDIAFGSAFAPLWNGVVRGGDRIFTNAFPYWVGEREASNLVADFLSEGLLHAPHAELGVRYEAGERVAAVAGAFGEALIAHDDSARNGFRIRVLTAVAIKGRIGELWPLASFEAGNGYGLFINRRELSLALGVRYVAW